MIVSYVIFIFIMITVLKSKYGFQFSKEVIGLLIVALFSLTLCLICIKWLGYPNAYFAEAIIVSLTIIYSVFELNKRINLKSVLVYLKTKTKR